MSQTTAIDDTQIAPIGHNSAPLTPFEAHAANIVDLFEEAKSWLEGDPISSPEQAAKVELLQGIVREAHKAADADRIKENAPFDAGKAEVQARYAPLLSDTTSMKGKTVMALAACKAALAPWRQKLEEDRRQEAKRQNEIAAAKAAEAQAAIQNAAADDLSAQEAADKAMREASKAQKVSAKADKAATTGLGLRSHWTGEITDLKAACGYFWKANPEAFRPLIQQLADADAKIHKADRPGITAHEDRRPI